MTTWEGFLATVAGPAPEPTPLTYRQEQILWLVAEGQSNVEIGKALYLSPSTIKTHLARIARVVGTGDRAAMVATCLRKGWIP